MTGVRRLDAADVADLVFRHVGTNRRSVMQKAKRDAGRDDSSQDKTRRRPAGSRTETKITDESDLGSDIQGKNSLQGDDQANRRNQRQTMPDED
jgi:hypothetical protein